MNRDVVEVVDEVDAATALLMRALLVQRGIFFLSRADTDDDIIVPSQIFCGMLCQVRYLSKRLSYSVNCKSFSTTTVMACDNESTSTTTECRTDRLGLL